MEYITEIIYGGTSPFKEPGWQEGWTLWTGVIIDDGKSWCKKVTYQKPDILKTFEVEQDSVPHPQNSFTDITDRGLKLTFKVILFFWNLFL